MFTTLILSSSLIAILAIGASATQGIKYFSSDKDIRKEYNSLFPAIDKLIEKSVNGKIS